MAVSPPRPEPAAERSDLDPAAARSAGTCPRCGTPYAALQEYCLECALRLPATRAVVTTLGTAWRRRIPWYPGDWIWPALLFLVIAALGALVAILATARQEDRRALVATSPPGRVTATDASATQAPTAPVDTAARDATGATATMTPPPSPPPAAPAQAAPIEWPAGESGYTVVLASIPTTRGRAAAEEEAERAIDAGLADVGILDSSQYSSLHPGYYVVFTGIRDSFSSTRPDLETAQASGYPMAYQRQISP